MVCAIQPEWIFLQCVNWDTEVAFLGVDKIIWETFLPHLFFGNTKTLTPIVVTLSTLPIKVDGLGLLNPGMLAKEKYPSSQQGSATLIRA